MSAPITSEDISWKELPDNKFQLSTLMGLKKTFAENATDVHGTAALL
jgi:hypothetical protein